MADDKTSEQAPSAIPALPKLTSRGDVAAAGLGLAAGFVLDSWHSMFGIPPGTFTIYGAAAAVGVKNTVQSLAMAVRANKIADRANRRAMEDSAVSRYQLEKMSATLKRLNVSRSQRMKLITIANLVRVDKQR
jgi:hypothetical protein